MPRPRNPRWFTLTVATVAAVSILGLGYWQYEKPPSGELPPPESRPFYLPPADQLTEDQKQTFGLIDTSNQRKAYRVVLISTALVVLIFSAGVIPRCPGAAQRLASLWWSRLKRVRFARGYWVGYLLIALLVVRLGPAVRKVPDFSEYGPAEMAITGMHLTMTLSHADRLAQGDVMFRDTTPKYGVLVPAILGAVEKQWGLLPVGTVYRVLNAVELAFLVLAATLFLRWARGRWWLCLLPLLLILPYYYASENMGVAPNHNPQRWLGMPLCLAAMYYLRAYAPVTVQLLGGWLAGLAVLINLESGAAAAAGMAAYLFFRYGPGGGTLRTNVVLLALRFAFGFVVAFAAFALFCRLALGAFPDGNGIVRTLQFVKLSAGGFGGYPPNSTFWSTVGWPVVMLTHAIATTILSALHRPHGFRQAFRAGLGTMFVVWFAYYANRPHLGNVHTYLFLYCFFLIDAGSYLCAAMRRPQSVHRLGVLVSALTLIFAIPAAYSAVDWQADPTKWKVVYHTSSHWARPLVRKGSPTAAPAVYENKVYLKQEFGAEILQRAAFLRKKTEGAGHRVIYFTVDAYFMNRLCGTVSWQEFCDPIEALDPKTYLRMLGDVFGSGHTEVYIDARSSPSLVFYGMAFDKLRHDLGAGYRLSRVESGWEVWTRIEPSKP